MLDRLTLRKTEMDGPKEQPQRNRVFWTGVTGSLIAALCCFTPILVLLLGAVGLGALIGYLDYVLLPALGVFLGLTVYGLSRRRQTRGEACCAIRDPYEPRR